MRQPSITYYPRIDEPAHLRDQLARAAWYLAPLKPVSIRIITELRRPSPGAFTAFTPEVANVLRDHPDLFQLSEHLPSETELGESDVVICWRGVGELQRDFGDQIVQRLGKAGTSVFDVNHTKRMEGSFYIDVSHRYMGNDSKVIDGSRQDFLRLCATHAKTRKSFLLCSGPEVQRYGAFDFSDGLSVVCNSVINDDALMEAVRPQIQIFGDPIFHFGCSQYAHRFRETLIDTYNKYRFHCVVPIKYYNLLCHWVPEVAEQVIAIPFRADQEINLSLDRQFMLHTTDNILTFLMLPIACSLSDEIHLLGCDGRPLDQNDYFWKHNPKTQFVNEMDNIQAVHPSFFKVDYDDYYLRHCDNVERYFTAGEVLGKSFHALTPSLIPAIHQREHPLAGWEPVAGVTYLVINRHGSNALCQDRLDSLPVGADDRVVWADTHDNQERKPFQIRAFDNAQSAQLAVPGEFADTVRQLDWLDSVFSVSAERVIIVQPDATAVDFQALSTSTLSRRPSVTILSSGELDSRGVTFLERINGHNPTLALFAADEQVQAEIFAASGLKLSLWGAAVAATIPVSDPKGPPATPRPAANPRVARPSNWQRARLDLEERDSDLAYELAMLHGKLDESAAALRADIGSVQATIEEQAQRIGSLDATLHGLADQLRTQAREGKRQTERLEHQMHELSEQTLQTKQQTERLEHQMHELSEQTLKTKQQAEGVEHQTQGLRAQFNDALQRLGERMEARAAAGEAKSRAVAESLQKAHMGLGEKFVSVRDRIAAELERSSAEVHTLDERLTGFSEALEAHQATLAQGITQLEKRILATTNANDFRHFTRYLGTAEAQRLADQWGPRLGFSMQPKAMSYLAHRICVIEDACSGRLATGVTDALIRLLCVLSINDRKLEYLEIGALFGVNMAIAWDVSRHRFRSAHLSCIDPLEGYYAKDEPDTLTGMTISRAVLEQNLRRVNIPDSAISVLQGFSQDKAIQARAAERRYNFLLIDGDHSYQGVKHDFEHYAPLVDQHGFVVIDDYGSREWPEISEYVDSHVIPDERFEVVGAESRTMVLRRVQ